MLDRIRVKNFKAHVDTEIDLKPITIFIGPNNSGKSTLFQLILLYKQLSLERDKNIGKLYSGSIPRKWKGEDILRVHGNNLVDLGDDPLDLKNDPLNDTVVVLEGSFNIYDKRLNAAGIDNGRIANVNCFDENMDMTCSVQDMIINSDHRLKLEWKKGEIFEINEQREISNINIKPIFQFNNGIVKPYRPYTYSKPDNISDKEYTIERIKVEEITNCFYHLMNSITFIYGVRGFELNTEMLTNIDNDRTEYIGLPQRSIALGNILSSNYEIKEEVSRWFQKILGISVYTETRQGANVIIKLRSERNKVMINEGLGTQQMLHMFIPIALANEMDTLMIEEPEIHLHPRTQAELMDLFIRVNREEKKQFIMSTHSEHIIYPLLSAISRGELKKEDVGIIYFTKDGKGVKVKALEIDDKGRVRGGLPGFFEQNLDEMMGYLNG